MNEIDESILDRALGTPNLHTTDLDDIAASLSTISNNLDEIKEKLSWIAAMATVIAGLLIIYFWKSGFISF